jgi:3-hydroxyisobutyrate dehydrogenase-like beta-hydroxyacid dehydrogenase
MIAGDFAPGFYIKHFLKDMGIALNEAEQRELSLEVLEKVKRMYGELRDKGLENLGTQALIKYYE